MNKELSLYSRYHKRYKKSEQKTASGKRHSLDLDDGLARALRGKDVTALQSVADENGIEWQRWKGMNPGRFRMTLGRVLRKMLKTNPVLVDGKEVKAL
jgi:hypothetical protein